MMKVGVSFTIHKLLRCVTQSAGTATVESQAVKITYLLFPLEMARTL